MDGGVTFVAIFRGSLFFTCSDKERGWNKTEPNGPTNSSARRLGGGPVAGQEEGEAEGALPLMS